MQSALVMTVIGEDKPGLVESISAIVVEHKGNWLESRMSRLGGYFAGILRVEVPPDKQAPLRSALAELKSKGLDIVIHADESPESPAQGRTQNLSIMGQDRPGIVRQISQALAKHGVNVESLSSETCSAAMSGETLFRAEATLLIPPKCRVEALKEDLEHIASDLIVEVTLQEPD